MGIKQYPYTKLLLKNNRCKDIGFILINNGMLKKIFLQACCIVAATLLFVIFVCYAAAILPSQKNIFVLYYNNVYLCTL